MVTAVTDIQHTHFASRVLGPGEAACVLAIGREMVGTEVTVVTEVII